MSSTGTLKKQAKNQLKKGWGLAIGSFFIAILFFPFILSIINFLFKNSDSIFLRTIIFLFTLIVNFLLFVGTLKFSLNYASSDGTPLVSDIFSGFAVLGKAVLIYIIMIFTICLGSILFILLSYCNIINGFSSIISLGLILVIIPGIIISLMLSQALYILVNDNNKSAIDCIKESINMMKGHKLEYFILSLSFIGWFMLIILPLFILIHYPLPIYFILIYLLLLLIGLPILLPYMNVTFALFYLKVKNTYYDFAQK